MMESIYGNINPEMDITISNPDVRTRTSNEKLQHTGSDCVKTRSSRAALVCLVLLCFLLLTAVIVLSVFIYTNNTNYTQERNQLLMRITNITEERDELIINLTNLTEEKDNDRNILSTKIDNLTKEKDQLNQEKNKLWMKLKETDGWLYYQSSLYLISSTKKNWTESRRYCTERGADLIIVNNTQEQEFFNKISRKDFFWIGLTDSDEEGRWKWVDGTNMATGSWGSGEPNGRRGENCALLCPSGLADYPCTDNFKWICENSLIKHHIP